MTVIQFTLIILLNCLKIIIADEDSSNLVNTRFKSVKCTSYNQTLFVFNECRVRVYSRNESAMIVRSTTSFPLKGKMLKYCDIYFFKLLCQISLFKHRHNGYS